MELNLEQVTGYKQDGYLVVENVVSGKELDTLRRRTEQIASGKVDFPSEWLEYEPGEQLDSRSLKHIRKINHGAEIDPVLKAHSNHEHILDCVASLIGPDIKYFGDQFFIKPPGGIEKTYHQDSPYFTIEPMDLVTAWTALDDVTIENGCLYVVPGSHHDGPLDHSDPWIVGDRTDMKVPDTAIDRSKERPVVLKAGDVSFHHSLILHRSGPNNTSSFRRGYATHYMSAKSHWTGDPADKPDYPLLRGNTFAGCV